MNFSNYTRIEIEYIDIKHALVLLDRIKERKFRYYSLGKTATEKGKLIIPIKENKLYSSTGNYRDTSHADWQHIVFYPKYKTASVDMVEEKSN